jgi:hypothetical protein
MKKLPEVGSIVRCGSHWVEYLILEHFTEDNVKFVRVQWLMPEEWIRDTGVCTEFTKDSMKTDKVVGKATPLMKALL